MRVLAIAIAVAAAGCGDDLTYAFDDEVQVSGESPFTAGCSGAAQMGDNHHDMEVEPMVAVDPTDGKHLVGAWQQDRWSNGGSNGTLGAYSLDGGATWTPTHAAFSRCAGGVAGSAGDYERASDPWVSIGPTGIVWQSALAFDGTTSRNAMVAATSADGGKTWSDAALLQADDDPDVLNDKDSITADPTDPGRAYVVWERLTGLTQPMMPIGTGPTMMARAEGGVWQPARAIYDPGVDAQTLGNIIVVLPDGTLVDVFEHFTMTSTTTPTVDIEVIRSTDHGDTWSAPITLLSAFVQLGLADHNNVPVRAGGMPAIAVDPTSGQIYVVVEAAFVNRLKDQIGIMTSTDGGLTWSLPVPVDTTQASSVAAFTPAVAVADDGTVGVSFYDTRDADGSKDHFDVAAFMVTSTDHGATWTEERLTGPFDLMQAALDGVYFLGDYQGLAASGANLVPFFVAAVVAPQDPTNVFVRPL
jgi:hypothetical protein